MLTWGVCVRGNAMVTRDELLSEAEWDKDRALASAGLPALRMALRNLEWLDPEDERPATRAAAARQAARIASPR